MANPPKTVQNRVRKRVDQVLALSVAGLTQQEIATKLGVHRSTIKSDLAQVKPALHVVNGLDERAVTYIENVMPIERRIDTYVKLAKNDRMPQYQQASAMRLDDMQGFISARDRLKAHAVSNDGNQQPLIVIEGVQLNFGPRIQVSSSTTGLPNQSVTDIEASDPGTPSPGTRQ